jgi:hypothetical protein
LLSLQEKTPEFSNPMQNQYSNSPKGTKGKKKDGWLFGMFVICGCQLYDFGD